MADPSNTKLMLSVKETAELLGETEDSIRSWLRAGVLSGQRTGKGDQGNWRVHSDCLRRFALCRSWINRITETTQVFWVTWKTSPLASDCQILREEHRDRFTEEEVKDADSWLPRLMKERRGPVRPQPPDDLPSSPR